MLKEGDTFENYEEALRAVKQYELATHQVFVVADGHTKLSINNPLCASHKYASMKFVCKHAGKHRTHRRGLAVSVRRTQTTFKTECSAYIKLKLIRDLVVVVKLSHANDHNHPTGEDIFQYYPENRVLTESEKTDVDHLIKCNVQRSIIYKTVNEKRRLSGASGKLIPKDIHNHFSSQSALESNGKSEAEKLETFLQELYAKSPGTDIRLVKETESERLQCLIIQTAEMKSLLLQHGETLFMDSTYRINCEHYCLYSVVVQDGNGFGQPVMLAFLANEKRDTLKKMFHLLKVINEDAINKTRCIFVDKDFTQLEVLKNVFPAAKVLLCCFHSMKAFKTRLAAEPLPKSRKTDILAQFKRVMCSYDLSSQIVEENRLKGMLNEDLRSYYERNWEGIKEMWTLTFRRNLPARGNRTTNRIERWFLMVKSAFRYSGRAIWTRYHLKDCVNIVMDVVLQKWSIASYNDFINHSKRLILHGFLNAGVAEVVGTRLTKLAAKIVEKQFVMLQAETHLVQELEEGEWLVVNMQQDGHRMYDVMKNDGQFCCSCYINNSFGIPCRHIFSVREKLKEAVFSIADVIAKWHRTESSAEKSDIHPEIVRAALQGLTDEAVFGEMDIMHTPKDHTKLGNRYREIKDVCERLASTGARFGGSHFTEVLKTLGLLEEQLLLGNVPDLVVKAQKQSGIAIRSGVVKRPKGRPNEGRRHRKFKKSVNTVETD